MAIKPPSPRAVRLHAKMLAEHAAWQRGLLLRAYTALGSAADATLNAQAAEVSRTERRRLIRARKGVLGSQRHLASMLKARGWGNV